MPRRVRAQRHTAWEMAAGAPSFSPLDLPQLTAWLSWANATDTGTLSVPDLKGGSPATQSSAGLKPTLGTTANGVTFGTFNSNVLSLPLSAAINDNLKFGIAFWMKLSDVIGIKIFASIVTGTGAASANKLLCNTFAGSLETRAQAVDRHAQVGGLDTNWRFGYIGIDCSKGTEATQVVIALDGVFGTVTFNSDTAWPSSLGTPTGNMLIGSGNNLGTSSPLVGSISDIYFFQDQLSAADVGRLMNFNRPL